MLHPNEVVLVVPSQYEGEVQYTPAFYYEASRLLKAPLDRAKSSALQAQLDRQKDVAFAVFGR